MGSFSHLLHAFAQREDSIFYFVLFLSAAAFLIAETSWIARQLKNSSRTKLLKKLPPDDARFEIFWTAVPALVLVLLVFTPASSRNGGAVTGQTHVKAPSAWSEKLRKRWMREHPAVIKEYDR